MQTIDLTCDCQSGYHRRSKRSKTYDGPDSDVEIIEAPRKPCSVSRAAEKYELGAEEDFAIFNETGQVRDCWYQLIGCWVFFITP